MANSSELLSLDSSKTVDLTLLSWRYFTEFYLWAVFQLVHVCLTYRSFYCHFHHTLEIGSCTLERQQENNHSGRDSWIIHHHSLCTPPVCSFSLPHFVKPNILYQCSSLLQRLPTQESEDKTCNAKLHFLPHATPSQARTEMIWKRTHLCAA